MIVTWPDRTETKYDHPAIDTNTVLQQPVAGNRASHFPATAGRRACAGAG